MGEIPSKNDQKFHQIWAFFVAAQNLQLLNIFAFNIEDKHFKIQCSAMSSVS